MFSKKAPSELPKNILIIRFSSIGDIVLTTPVIRAVKRQMPDAQVHFLTKPNFKAVVEGNPYIDELHLLKEDFNATIQDLKNAKIDFVVDLHQNLRTLKVKQALGVPSESFPKLNVQKWLLVNFKMKSLMPDKSIVERYFETVSKLGIKNDGEGLDYFIPEDSKIKQDDLPMSHWAGFVACVLGGSKGTKQLPISQWIDFATACPYPIVMLGGPEDKAMGDAIAAAIPNMKVYNSCGKFKLNESADIVRKAKVVVSNDTGLMHIAAAFQKPIVSLWGNTIPELGMYPYYGANNLKEIVSNKSVIVENNNLSCRPCSKIGYDQCPKKHFKCMRDLDMKKAVDAVVAFWS